MKLQTKYFGEIEYDADDCFAFPNGLYGFEEEKEFLLIPFEGGQSSLLCLQSIQTPALAFIMMDPFSLKQDYSPVLQSTELSALGVNKYDELCYYVMCVVKHPISDSTLNFKCPVVINPTSHVSMQVILESDEYGMRHLLSEFNAGEGASVC